MAGSALTTDAPTARVTLRGVIQWWGQLVAPRGQYASETELIRARLLANMLSAMVLVGTPIVLYYMLRNPEIPITTDLWLAAGSIGVMLMLIGINRAGSTHAAALGFVSILTGLFVVGSFSDGSSIRFLFMSAVGLILTATFFPTRILIVTLGVTLVAVLGLNSLIPRYETRHVIDYCVFATLIAVTSSVMMNHFHRLEAARLDKLAAANAALRESESQLEKRVALRTEELRAAKEDAEAARDRSQRADRVKSQFLASMSHELRTPLNAILNFTEFVSMGMLGPVTAQQVDALTKSRDSARHLLALINDMLDITKIESGMLSLFVEENIDLHAELDTVIGSARALIASKPAVAFIVDVDANLPPVTGDRRRIRQALLNLLSNAAKFTEQGSITLSVKARGARILFAVIDTGPGIAADDHDLIFEPFRQTATGAQHAGGTGLGLPITLRLVEAHGGRLWLESEPGQGSAFYFELPVSNLSLIAQARDNRATEKLV